MKIKILFISVFVTLFVASFVLAQQTSIAPISTSRKEQVNQRIQELDQLRNQIREERTQLLLSVREERRTFHNDIQKLLQNYATSTPEQKQQIREEIKRRQQEMKENILALRNNLRENAKVLRENFRERFKDIRIRVRIAAAHGNGLRMINRYRAALQRFSHILGRLEFRVEKLKERGIDVSLIEPLLEDARAMEEDAEAKLEELKANYEDLLSGEKRVSEIDGKGKTINKELKEEIIKLHNKLKEIVLAIAKLDKSETNRTATSSGSSSSEATTSETNND